ncbi:MAG: hypothetical protein BA871_09955 [Desulfuromonadales bacterium C00003096]|nr:MAG: hypothetical protein BA871_09955 [Desulfuromonadales bacterium C00003096]
MFIAIGVILPDLIDKPIGRILLGESVANGRLFGHTLLFVLISVHFFFLQKTFLRSKKWCKQFLVKIFACKKV